MTHGDALRLIHELHGIKDALTYIEFSLGVLVLVVTIFGIGRS